MDNLNVIRLFSVLSLGGALWLSRSRQESLGDLLDSLGAEMSQSKREAINRYLAKKFWGTHMLTKQSAQSMSLISQRIKDYNPEASASASAMRSSLLSTSDEALSNARKYDSRWVEWKMSGPERGEAPPTSSPPAAPSEPVALPEPSAAAPAAAPRRGRRTTTV